MHGWRGQKSSGQVEVTAPPVGRGDGGSRRADPFRQTTLGHSFRRRRSSDDGGDRFRGPIAPPLPILRFAPHNQRFQPQP